jgi:hypothetical protein
MGLNERRKIKELQETTLPGRVKDIEEIWERRFLTRWTGTASTRMNL